MLYSLKSRGLTAWLWLFKNVSQAKAAMKQDPRKSPKRCVLAHKIPYPDFFSKFYPDSQGYLQNFGPYPDYDMYLKKKKKKPLNISKNHIKISPACTPTLLHPS